VVPTSLARVQVILELGDMAYNTYDKLIDFALIMINDNSSAQADNCITLVDMAFEPLFSITKKAR